MCNIILCDKNIQRGPKSEGGNIMAGIIVGHVTGVEGDAINKAPVLVLSWSTSWHILHGAN